MPAYISPHTTAQLEVLATALQSRRTALLLGESGSGKTYLLKLLAKLSNRKLVTIHVHSETGGLANEPSMMHQQLENRSA